MTKIRIYLDSGADISKLKSIAPRCDFYQIPYDSPDRPKKKPLLAVPSECQCRDWHVSWEESTPAWGDMTGSALHSEIEAIIGGSNRRDVLHFDTAYKTECLIFLTSDKGDIWSKRALLENLTGIKVLHTPFGSEQALTYISDLLNALPIEIPIDSGKESSSRRDLSIDAP
ncbi:MAG TPA: hypothetical protein DCE71_04690 [Parachlamydiales bacterium]|nr:hypothetical protein [Parachlamydiales bacterium]